MRRNFLVVACAAMVLICTLWQSTEAQWGSGRKVFCEVPVLLHQRQTVVPFVGATPEYSFAYGWMEKRKKDQKWIFITTGLGKVKPGKSVIRFEHLGGHMQLRFWEPRRGGTEKKPNTIINLPSNRLAEFCTQKASGRYGPLVWVRRATVHLR